MTDIPEISLNPGRTETRPVHDPVTKEERRRAEGLELAKGISEARARNVLGVDIKPKDLVAFGLEYADALLAAVDGKGGDG